MRPRLLVTGANSFIGAALLRRLNADNEYDVVATYRQQTDALLTEPHPAIEYQSCDLSDPGAITALFQSHKFDGVIHLAAARPGTDEAGFGPVAERDNIKATLDLLKSAHTTGCARFVFVSAIGVYDGADDADDGLREDMVLSPTSIFGQSKLKGETSLQAHCDAQMTGVSLRMPGVHGPGKKKGAVYGFLKAALAGTPLTVSEPESRFRLLFIDDAVDALVLALKADLSQPYCCYNVAGQEVLSLLDLANAVLAVTNSKSPCNVAENSVCRRQVLSITKTQRELGFSPQSIETHLTAFQNDLES